jgi:hypothetical protein
MLSATFIILLNATYAECQMFSYCYAECRYAECRYADCRGATHKTLK